MSAKKRILDYARNLFLKYGVKCVTLDEIAKDLGISKKTIYQYFKNKASIIYEVMEAYCAEEKQEVEHIETIAENAIDELIRIYVWTSRTFENVSPRFVYEIAKYYPKSFEIQHKYMSSFVFQKLKENLSRGIAEGLYRKELNPDLVARIRISQFDFTLSQDYFPLDVFDIWEVQIELFCLYMYGIVTEKGREFLEDHLPLIPRKSVRRNKTSYPPLRNEKKP